MSAENLALWERNFKTDPNYTKAFSRGGGFKGTAINATYLSRKATEEFGPCGVGWGVEVLEDKVVDGAPLIQGDLVVGYEKVHYCRIRLWYRHPEAKRNRTLFTSSDEGYGAVEHYGQTTMVGKNKNGFFTDEEAPKKSLTDAVSKALAQIGFCADIHLGLFDDNKYVADRRNEVAAEKKGKRTGQVSDASTQPASGSGTPAQLGPQGDAVTQIANEIAAATTVEELQAAGQRASGLPKEAKPELGKLYTAKLNELKGKNA